MPEIDVKELNESIQLLSQYRDRLQKEVAKVARKLQMPSEIINKTLINNSELIQINEAIKHLRKHQQRQTLQKEEQF